MLIVMIDVLVFALLCTMTGMSYNDFQATYKEDAVEGSGVAFVVLSDGFILFLFFIRTVLGLYYTAKTIWPPKMDYQYLQEFGKLKWHTKRVKTMRINFKNYTLMSNISSIFILVQTTVLLAVSFA